MSTVNKKLDVSKLLKGISAQARGWAHFGVSTAATSVDKAADFLKGLEGRLTTLATGLATPKADPAAEKPAQV